MTRLNKLTFFLVCAIVIFTTLAYGTVHQPIIAFFYLLVGIGIVFWGLDCLSTGSVRFSRSQLQIPLILFGIYGLVQIIPFGVFAEVSGVADVPRTISLEPFATRLTSIHIFTLCAFFGLCLAYIDSAVRLRRVVTLITVFGFVYAFYAILQSVLSPTRIYGIYGPQGAIPFGSFVNRHNFAAIIEMAVSIPLGLLFAGAVRRDKRLLYVVAITLMTSAMLLSGSRGGLVALVSAIILLVILTTRAKGRKNLVLKAALSMLLIFASVGGAVFVGGDTSLTRFSDAAATHDISSSRTQIWALTLNVISNHMPLGAGLGAFPAVFTRYDAASGMERVEQAHNDYLQVLADAGIVGLVIGSLFLFWIFREGFRNVRVDNTFRRGTALGAFAGCFAVLVHSAFDFVLHISAISVMFLMMMAILVASGRKYEDDIDEFDDEHPRRRRSASVTSIDDRHRRRRSSQRSGQTSRDVPVSEES